LFSSSNLSQPEVHVRRTSRPPYKFMSTTTRAPSRSALSSLISSDSPTTQQSPTAGLTAQILHNLQHQHLWTSLRVYDPLTLSPTQCIPLISGFPPQAIYTHPDEQAYMLEHGIRGEDVPVESVWVLPTTQGQLWSLAGDGE